MLFSISHFWKMLIHMFVLVGIKPFWPLLCLPNVWNFVRYLLAKGTSIIGLQSWKKIFDSFIVLNNAFSFQCKLSVDTSFVQYIQFSIMHILFSVFRFIRFIFLCWCFDYFCWNQLTNTKLIFVWKCQKLNVGHIIFVVFNKFLLCY